MRSREQENRLNKFNEGAAFGVNTPLVLKGTQKLKNMKHIQSQEKRKVRKPFAVVYKK